MKFKKVPKNILDKPDNEVDETIKNLPYRQFATSTDELKDHIFISRKILELDRGSMKSKIHKGLLYLSPEYRVRLGLAGIMLKDIPIEVFNKYEGHPR